MKRVLRMAMAGLMLGALAGCNDVILGNWTSKEVKPPEGAKHFKIGNISFEKTDGQYSYASTSDYGKGPQKSKGTYSFNGMQLKLKTDEGTERVYDAQFNSFTQTFHVTHKENGEKTTVVLEKAK